MRHQNINHWHFINRIFMHFAQTSGLHFAKIQKNYIILNAQTYIFTFRRCILTNSNGVLSGNCLNLEKIHEKVDLLSLVCMH